MYSNPQVREVAAPQRRQVPEIVAWQGQYVCRSVYQALPLNVYLKGENLRCVNVQL